jgi:hypothetical protein
MIAWISKLLVQPKQGLIVLSDFSSQKIRQRKLISVASVDSSDKRERARDKIAVISRWLQHFS